MTRAERKEHEAWVVRQLCWFAQIAAAGRVLEQHAPAEWAEFLEWERTHVTGDGPYGTSDWPGWTRYCDPP